MVQFSDASTQLPFGRAYFRLIKTRLCLLMREASELPITCPKKEWDEKRAIRPSYATLHQCEGEEVIISSSCHLFDVHLRWTERDFKLRKEKKTISFFSSPIYTPCSQFAQSQTTTQPSECWRHEHKPNWAHIKLNSPNFLMNFRCFPYLPWVCDPIHSAPMFRFAKDFLENECKRQRVNTLTHAQVSTSSDGV